MKTDTALGIIKFRRRRRIMMRNTLFVFLCYALTQALSLVAWATGISSISPREIAAIAGASLGISIVFLAVIASRKGEITTAFANAVFFGQFAFWLVLYLLWILALNEIRIAGLFFAILALSFTLSNTNLLQSLSIALATAMVQIAGTYFAIVVLRQKGALFTEIFFTLCFLPAALFITYLADQFQRQRDEIKAAKRTAERARDALWGEMRLAEKIQTVLLPQHPSIPGYDVSAFMKPAEEVGGDYYDIINTPAASWVVIGDVSGHGVSAGIIMMMVESIIQAVVRERPTVPPGELLRIANRAISHNIRRMDEENYMTITALSIDADGAALHAGLHLDILVYRARDGAVESIPTEGMWLGIRPEIGEFTRDGSFQIDPGDVMLLYTDGVIEAKDVLGAQFGGAALARILAAHGRDDTRTILEKIIEQLSLYRPDDDATLVILKRLARD
ncbi:MAG TPA: PP2C family protein-serine/threonine phosphatase [Spirochaetota bacterium]|nr:PP2C family protein-serine/threonine phosphatase [Spirochaetota bacterium]HOS38874.1 PP2C family protein-serine/threonine phosphatase [Spirochaetota bacterium]HPI22397.1 PP2C family protein-serine/threonine phosphatase [Spirochaetota bacterium]HPU88144.1 PP2C family protein-serine/threonine phosphatase [Spirochaetota bacterium]